MVIPPVPVPGEHLQKTLFASRSVGRKQIATKLNRAGFVLLTSLEPHNKLCTVYTCNNENKANGGTQGSQLISFELP